MKRQILTLMLGAVLATSSAFAGRPLETTDNDESPKGSIAQTVNPICSTPVCHSQPIPSPSHFKIQGFYDYYEPMHINVPPIKSDTDSNTNASPK